MSTTQQNDLATVIASMLVENTGSSFLDSGGTPSYDSEGNYTGSSGGYGRAHERNRAMAGDDPVAAFKAKPDSYWHWPSVYPHPNFRDGKDPSSFRAELNPTHDVFHWLVDYALADYNEEMDKALQEFGNSDDMAHEGWLGVMEAFPEHWARLVAKERALEESANYKDDFADYEDEMTVIEQLKEDFYIAPSGFYGDGQPVINNTYNGEDCLSQTLQFAYFEHDHSSYCLLQIHGGADVRGGYTAPRAFDLGSHGDGTEIFENARASCGCDNEECAARWYSDDAGSHWYADTDFPELHELPAREGTFVEAGFLNRDNGVLFGDELPTIVIEERGEYASTNKVWCPICGKGELSPWLY